MTCVTQSLCRLWSGSTSLMLCSRDRRGMSCVLGCLWKTLTASQVRNLSLCQDFKGKPTDGKSRNQSYCEGNNYSSWSIIYGIRKLHKYQFYRKPSVHMLILTMKMEKKKKENPPTNLQTKIH